jgi:hypothetical protein
MRVGYNIALDKRPEGYPDEFLSARRKIRVVGYPSFGWSGLPVSLSKDQWPMGLRLGIAHSSLPLEGMVTR